MCWLLILHTQYFKVIFVYKTNIKELTYEAHMMQYGSPKSWNIYLQPFVFSSFIQLLCIHVIFTLFQVVGFIWGYICQQFSQTMYILCAGFVLSGLVSEWTTTVHCMIIMFLVICPRGCTCTVIAVCFCTEFNFFLSHYLKIIKFGGAQTHACIVNNGSWFIKAESTNNSSSVWCVILIYCLCFQLICIFFFMSY